MRQLVITKCDSFIYYKVRQLVITKCDSYFITKCDKCYYKMRQVSQSVTVLLQSATGITKCDDYYKVRQNRHQMQARVNTCEQGTFGFGFTSYWLRKWHQFYQPITERSNAKPKQKRNYFRHLISLCTITKNRFYH